MEERKVPADVGAVFKESWRMFTTGWAQYVTTMLIIYVPGWIISGLVAVAVGLPFLRGITYGYTPGSAYTGAFVSSIIVVVIVGAVLAALENAAVISLFDMQWHNEPLRWQEAIRRGVPFIWTVIGTSVLVAFMTLLGFLLFVIPGIIVMFLMSLVVQAIVLDRLPAIPAISASARAASRAWLPVLAVILVSAALSTGLHSLFGHDAGLGAFVSAVFGVFLTTWSSIAMGLAYLSGSQLVPAGGAGGSPPQPGTPGGSPIK